MTTPLPIDPRATRLAACTAAIVAMYWGIYRMPLPGAGEGLDRDDAERLVEVATAMRKYGRWEKARGPLERLHAAYPGSHIYMRDLADTYRQLGRFGDEAAMWAKFMDSSPAPEEACPRAAHAWRDAGRTEQMFQTLDRCLAAVPSNPDMVYHKAYAQERWGDRSRAEMLYTEGLKRFPANGEMRLGLARLQLHDGRQADALATARQILASFQDNVDALLVAGLAARASGDLSGARQYLERGARLAPAYTDFHLALADIAARQADLGAVRNHLRSVLENEPGNREVKAKLEALGEL